MVAPSIVTLCWVRTAVSAGTGFAGGLVFAAAAVSAACTINGSAHRDNSINRRFMAGFLFLGGATL